MEPAWVLLGQLQGDLVKLGGAEHGEHRGDQSRELRVGELRHPAPDCLQSPLKLLRLQPRRRARADLRPPVEGCLLIFSRQRVTFCDLVMMLSLMFCADRGEGAAVTMRTAVKHRGLGENGLSSELVLTFLQIQSFLFVELQKTRFINCTTLNCLRS